MARHFAVVFRCAALALLFACAHTCHAAPAETTQQFPPNQWVPLKRTVVIPEQWKAGRLKGVNSYGSHVYCDKLGAVLSVDGYTTAPAGKSTPNNYSDSLYGYNPETGVFRLIKRSNWRAGARAKGSRGSYPLDDNRDEPTPCPRHTYNGICYSADTKKFYVINGANAGVPNTQHPKWVVNKGTGVFTFWEFDFDTLKWTQLAYPKVGRKEPYETVLRAMPGTGKLYLIQTWSLWCYDTKKATWSAVIPKGRAGIGSGNYGCAATVDPKRQRIVMMNSGAKVRKGRPITDAHKTVSMRYFDVATKKFIPIPTIGLVQGKRKGGLAYVDHMDCYAARTEEALYLYFPETDEWKKPKMEHSKGEGSWSYMVYDRVRRILVLKHEAALRLDPETLEYEKGTAKKISDMTKP